jgi:hypothetical protein
MTPLPQAFLLPTFLNTTNEKRGGYRVGDSLRISERNCRNKILLGVLVGYTLRGKQKLLIRFLVTLAVVVYVIVPAIALWA